MYVIKNLIVQIAQNIDIKVPEEGEVIKRIVELANERNISYTPSHDNLIALNDYCRRKEIPVTHFINISYRIL